MTPSRLRIKDLNGSWYSSGDITEIKVENFSMNILPVVKNINQMSKYTHYKCKLLEYYQYR